MTYEQAVEILGPADPCTGEPITPEELLDILKQDVIEAADRPGSWEGANMLEVLLCHGFIEP